MPCAYDIIAALVDNIQDDIDKDDMSKHMAQALDDAINYLKKHRNDKE